VSEFHQMYNVGAVGGQNELIRFWGQKVRGQGHKKTNHIEIEMQLSGEGKPVNDSPSKTTQFIL